ncbi:hypothetical protein GCM10009106_26450 [Sphingomonas japonica]|nr:hypothetical protein [Sphingomonas japonica]
MRWLILLAAAIAARATTFGNPILHVDEQFYFVVADAMAKGALPFVDIWDRKPIGLFALYLPAAALGWPLGILAYQALALAFAVATAGVIGAIARRVGWERGALAAGILYLLWLNFAEGQGGQAPVFYNLPVAGAVLVLSGGASRGRAVAAMALFGLALQIKYSVVFEGIALGCWVLWQRRRDPPLALAGLAAAMIAAALLPTAAALGGYAVLGHADRFLFANFWSILDRAGDPVGEQAGNLAIVALILAPLVALAFAGRSEGAAGTPRSLIRLWLAAAITALIGFGGWFDHYALPAIAAACTCSAGFFASERRSRRAVTVFLIATFVGGQAVLALKRHERGTAAEFAALTRAVGRGNGCLLIYSGPTMLYPATGRCRVSALVFPSHLSRTREAGAVGVDQRAALAAALATRPAWVVAEAGYRGERPDIRRRLEQVLGQNYRPIGTYALGTKRITVFCIMP